MFTKDDERIIGLIINLCKQDNKLKKNLETKYDNNPNLLNPYEIYVLEEVNRYGLNNYYQEICKCGNNLNGIVKEYKAFMKRCKEIPEFKILKVKDYYKNDNDLNEIEKVCIRLILENEKEKKKLEKLMMYTYDDYVELKIDTDDDIRNTIANLFFRDILAMFLEKMVDEHTYKNMIERQLAPGMFASVDKEYIISKLKINNMKDAIIDATEKSFETLKMDIENGIGLDRFISVFGWGIEDAKINISYSDVYGKLEKNKTLN